VGWGLVTSANSVGLVVGALVLLRFRPRHPLRLGMAGMVCEVPLFLVLGLVPSAGLLAAAALVTGVGLAMFGIAWETALQQHVPHEKLSRVASYDMLGSFVALPVGQLAAGPLAEAFGVREVIVVGAAVYALVALGTLGERSVWRLERADGTESLATPGSAPAAV
jgi:MFS family permease